MESSDPIEIGRYVMAQLKVDTYDALYECLNFDVLKNLLHHKFKTLFHARTIDFVRSCYPEWKVCSWKFKSPLKYQWTDKDNRIFAIQYIGEKEGWITRKDYYKLTVVILETHLGKGFLDFYGGRFSDILNDVMPPSDPTNKFAEDVWLPWLLGNQSETVIVEGERKKNPSTPKDLWTNHSNRVWFIEWLCQMKGYSIPNELRRLNKEDFVKYHGIGMVVKYYDTCVSRCLQDLFPQYIDKLQWFMFKRKPTGSFKTVTDFIPAMKYMREKAGWLKPDDFYSLDRSDFAAFDLVGLIRPQHKTFADAVIELNPDLTFDKTKFNYHKTEKLVMDLLKKHNCVYSSSNVIYTSSSGGKFRMDIYIPSLNLYIEIDGDQHFKGRLERFQTLGWNVHICRDVFKMKEALKTGASILRIVQMEALNGKDSWFMTHVLPHIKSYTTPTIRYITTTEKYKDVYLDHELFMTKEIVEDDLYV